MTNAVGNLCREVPISFGTSFHQGYMTTFLIQKSLVIVCHKGVSCAYSAKNKLFK